MQMLTIGEISNLTKLCPRTLRKLRTAGLMPRPVKIGRSVRWRADDIAMWLTWGCPGRDEFERLVAQREGGAR